MIGPYATAHAFRSALEARLRNRAQAQGTDLQRLRRQVAFERLLARLFAAAHPPWLLKGGYALELRLSHQARATVDLDFSIPAPTRRYAADVEQVGTRMLHVFEALQSAAEQDQGDGFVFYLRHPTAAQTGAPGGGFRCGVEARLAGRPFAHFHAYTYPWQDRENTRVKDLVDLVLLIEAGLLTAEPIRQALAATFVAGATHPIPLTLPPPPRSWAESYASLAAELQLAAATLDEAYQLVADYWQMQRLGQGGS